jgi:hypothetical protein
VLILEFLNRISFFSVLTWGFFLIAAVSAILLTSFRSALLRKYRSTLIATASSALLLGALSWSFPLILSRVNPDQSVLTPIDQLVPTEWIEPVSNPETSISPEEETWATGIHYAFRYKLKFGYEFRSVLLANGSTLVVQDSKGNIHGFNAYTGLNHWMIPLRVSHLLQVAPNDKKLYVLERTSLDALRLSVLDYQNPVLLWQRTLPRSKEGAIALDSESQTVAISAGQNGIWALKTKTGEVLWKRPEIFSKTTSIPGSRAWVAFEPKSSAHAGFWILLDPNTGKTLQKAQHDLGDLKALTLIRPASSTLALGLSDSDRLFLFNPSNLSFSWTTPSEVPILLPPLSDRDHFFVLKDNHLLERRRIRDNELAWQAMMAPVKNPTLKISPDGRLFGLPSEEEDALRKVRFFKVEDGSYLAEAQTSEATLDWVFLGDWLYLMSENHLWAFKRP